MQRLTLLPDPDDVAESSEPQTLPVLGNDVFVVHGTDGNAKQSVARFLEKRGLNSVILHEQADEGRTIIEKFEQHSEQGFAVVLLTADDEVSPPCDQGVSTHRARPNVIFELGFFIGRLGRRRVCALKKGDLELPSDISGVLYGPMESDDNWKLRLARELSSAGFEVDLEGLLSAG